jgi:hypothetical protein
MAAQSAEGVANALESFADVCVGVKFRPRRPGKLFVHTAFAE